MNWRITNKRVSATYNKIQVYGGDSSICIYNICILRDLSIKENTQNKRKKFKLKGKNENMQFPKSIISLSAMSVDSFVWLQSQYVQPGHASKIRKNKGCD